MGASFLCLVFHAHRPGLVARAVDVLLCRGLRSLGVPLMYSSLLELVAHQVFNLDSINHHVRCVGLRGQVCFPIHVEFDKSTDIRLAIIDV